MAHVDPADRPARSSGDGPDDGQPAEPRRSDCHLAVVRAYVDGQDPSVPVDRQSTDGQAMKVHQRRVLAAQRARGAVSDIGGRTVDDVDRIRSLGKENQGPGPSTRSAGLRAALGVPSSPERPVVRLCGLEIVLGQAPVDCAVRPTPTIRWATRPVAHVLDGLTGSRASRGGESKACTHRSQSQQPTHSQMYPSCHCTPLSRTGGHFTGCRYFGVTDTAG